MQDTAKFQFDVLLDGKAVAADDGKLRVEGYAAGFDVDRQDEAFEKGAFEKGLQNFLKRGAPLLYHHHYDKSLGVVEEARVDSKGLFLKARLDDPEPGTELADVYNKVKSGSIKGFSVGGIFKRKQTPAGLRIHQADLVEVSITPVPVQPDTLFAVAGKAFSEDGPTAQELAAFEALATMVDELEGKAIASGYMEGEMPQLITPGDVAKAVDRTATGVEEEQSRRAHIMRAAEVMDCQNLIPTHWFEDDETAEGKAVSAAKRKNAKYHFPGTDKYPIDNCADVKKAAALVGSSTADADKVKSYVKRAGAALGCTAELPETWTA